MAALYVGEDWLLYVDACAGYPDSETIAPCLMLSQPGHRLTVRTSTRAIGPATASLHAPAAMTRCDDAHGGAAFLYLDPLSASGRAAQALCAPQGSAPWDAAASGRWTASWFDQLVAGLADPHAVAGWVADLQRDVCERAPAGLATDRRLRTVATVLGDDASGRVCLPQLAAQVHCSPEHLRKAFRLAAGMTLSRYQMWRRLHRMVSVACVACVGGQPGFAAHTLATLQDAGFYDGPHGSRMVRRYFGLSARSALEPGLHRARCA